MAVAVTSDETSEEAGDQRPHKRKKSNESKVVTRVCSALITYWQNGDGSRWL